MINYLIGKIKHINKKYVILESNWIGYSICVGASNKFVINSTQKIFVYQNTKIDNKNNIFFELYGFLTIEEKVFFINLLTVPGIGTKTAINIMAHDVKALIQLIKQENANELVKKFKITPRLSKVICENLHKTYSNVPSTGEALIETVKNKNVEIELDVKSALQIMGYSKQDIDYCLEHLKNHENALDLNEAVSTCIKSLIKFNESQTTIPKN